MSRRNEGLTQQAPDTRTRSWRPLFFVIMLPVIPAGIIAFILYIIFFAGMKYPPKMIAFIAGMLSIPTALISVFLEPFSKGILVSYLYICLWVGLVFFVFYSFWQAGQLKKYPELKQLDGWAKDFEYSPTPFEKMRKHKIVEEIRNGECYGEDGATLGVLEEPVIIDSKTKPLDEPLKVKKYYTEAVTHTIVTGASGSGKALHKDTPIPTNKGFVPIKDIFEGDVVYDEYGFDTRVLEKHHPIIDKSYTITFSRSYRGYLEEIVVKACGDHLWEVYDIDLNESVVMDTEKLSKSLKKRPDSFVLKPLRDTVITWDDKREEYKSVAVEQSLKALNGTQSDVFVENGIGYKDSLVPYFSSLACFVGEKETSLCISKTAGSRVYSIEIKEDIDFDKNDYYCLTVSSPSKLFLCTEHFLPTHNTVSILSQVKNDIKTGHPVVLIDCKNANDVAYFLAKWAKEEGRRFFHFFPGGAETYRNPYNDKQATYDPLMRGNATYKQELLLELREWSLEADVYYRQSRDALASLSFLISEIDEMRAQGLDYGFDLSGIRFSEGGVATYADALEPTNLFNLMRSYQAYYADKGKKNMLRHTDQRNYETLNDFYKTVSRAKDPSGQRKQLESYKSMLSGLLLSSYGEWMISRPNNPKIDLLDTSRNGNGDVILFSIGAMEDGEFAKYIGSMILSNLKLVAAEKNRKGDNDLLCLYIDEFQTLDVTQVSDVLGKARSAGIATTLSLQSLNQITADGKYPKQMIDSILDTCGNFLVHAGSKEDTAEDFFSKIIGRYKQPVIRGTRNLNTSHMSVNFFNSKQARVNTDYEDVFIVPPEKFQELSSPGPANSWKSTAYYITKRCDEPAFSRVRRVVARHVLMIAEDEITEGVPEKALRYMSSAAPATSRPKPLFSEDDVFKVEKMSKEEIKRRNDLSEARRQAEDPNKRAKMNRRPPRRDIAQARRDAMPTRRDTAQVRRDAMPTRRETAQAKPSTTQTKLDTVQKASPKERRENRKNLKETLNKNIPEKPVKQEKLKEPKPRDKQILHPLDEITAMDRVRDWKRNN